MSELTDTRGEQYGPPSEHHAKTAQLTDILLGGKAPSSAIQWQACMILDKLVRLSHTWNHRDSIADVKGYAECMEMTLDGEPNVDVMARVQQQYPATVEEAYMP